MDNQPVAEHLMQLLEPVENAHYLDLSTDNEGYLMKGQKELRVGTFPEEIIDFVLTLSDLSEDDEIDESPVKPCHWHIPRTACICIFKPRARRKIAYAKLSLRFNNYLHELSKDYTYLITVTTISDGPTESELCSFEEIRTARTMDFLIDMRHSDSCIKEQFQSTNIHVRMERFFANESTNQASNLFEPLLDSALHSDVTLIVDNVSLRAHKCILSCRSLFFERMFQTPMIESETGQVIIGHISVEVMKQVLRFIYTGTLPKITDIPGELLQAADRFQIDDLKEKCVESMIFFVTPLNCYDVINVLNQYNVFRYDDKLSAFNKYKALVRPSQM